MDILLLVFLGICFSNGVTSHRPRIKVEKEASSYNEDESFNPVSYRFPTHSTTFLHNVEREHLKKAKSKQSKHSSNPLSFHHKHPTTSAANWKTQHTKDFRFQNKPSVSSESRERSKVRFDRGENLNKKFTDIDKHLAKFPKLEFRSKQASTSGRQYSSVPTHNLKKKGHPSVHSKGNSEKSGRHSITHWKFTDVPATLQPLNGISGRIPFATSSVFPMNYPYHPITSRNHYLPLNYPEKIPIPGIPPSNGRSKRPHKSNSKVLLRNQLHSQNPSPRKPPPPAPRNPTRAYAPNAYRDYVTRPGSFLIPEDSSEQERPNEGFPRLRNYGYQHQPPPPPRPYDGPPDSSSHSAYDHSSEDHGKKPSFADTLPTDYRDEIEQHAEVYIKQKKSQNATSSGPNGHSVHSTSSSHTSRPPSPSHYHHSPPSTPYAPPPSSHPQYHHSPPSTPYAPPPPPSSHPHYHHSPPSTPYAPPPSSQPHYSAPPYSHTQRPVSHSSHAPRPYLYNAPPPPPASGYRKPQSYSYAPPTYLHTPPSSAHSSSARPPYSSRPLPPRPLTVSHSPSPYSHHPRQSTYPHHPSPHTAHASLPPYDSSHPPSSADSYTSSPPHYSPDSPPSGDTHYYDGPPPSNPPHSAHSSSEYPPSPHSGELDLKELEKQAEVESSKKPKKDRIKELILVQNPKNGEWEVSKDSKIPKENVILPPPSTPYGTSTPYAPRLSPLMFYRYPSYMVPVRRRVPYIAYRSRRASHEARSASSPSATSKHKKVDKKVSIAKSRTPERYERSFPQKTKKRSTIPQNRNDGIESYDFDEIRYNEKLNFEDSYADEDDRNSNATIQVEASTSDHLPRQYHEDSANFKNQIKHQAFTNDQQGIRHVVPGTSALLSNNFVPKLTFSNNKGKQNAFAVEGAQNAFKNEAAQNAFKNEATQNAFKNEAAQNAFKNEAAQKGFNNGDSKNAFNEDTQNLFNEEDAQISDENFNLSNDDDDDDDDGLDADDDSTFKGNYQYVHNPEDDAYEYGYRMGTPEHTIERSHKTSGILSKIKMNWKDGKGNFGEHLFEYNHFDDEEPGLWDELDKEDEKEQT